MPRVIRGLLCCGLLLFLSPLLLAQSNLRGQVFGPDGQQLEGEVRIEVISSEESFQKYFFSDSNGRFIITGLRTGKTYRLIIEGNGSTHNGTRETVNTENIQYLTLFLKPREEPRKKNVGRPGSVGVEQLSRQVAPAVARNYNEAQRLIRDNQFPNAARQLELVIDRDRRFFEAHNDLGVVYMKMNRLEDAARSLQRAAELKPNDYRPWLNLGVVRSRQNKFVEAIAPLEKSLQLKPDFPDAQRYLGEALLEVGRLEEADKQLTAAYEAGDSNRPTVIIKLAIVKVQRNNNPGAIQLLEKYLTDYPKAGNRAEIESILKQLRP